MQRDRLRESCSPIAKFLSAIDDWSGFVKNHPRIASCSRLHEKGRRGLLGRFACLRASRLAVRMLGPSSHTRRLGVDPTAEDRSKLPRQGTAQLATLYLTFASKQTRNVRNVG